MIKKEITYEDFDGSKKTETFYFNLTKAELMKFEVSEPGGMRKRMQAIGESQDPVEVLNILERIIHISIGERKPDGKFIKSEDFADSFIASDAYSELFLNLMSNVDNAAEFVTGLLPASLIDEVSKSLEISNSTSESSEQETKDILNGMSSEQIAELKKALLSKED